MIVENLKITKVLEVQKGTSKAGKEWQKLTFVGETSEEYNNLYAFEVFGVEKVEQFNNYNKVGDVVNVEFNVNCNEWKDKYFTTLSAWKINKSQGTQGIEPALPQDSSEDLPF